MSAASAANGYREDEQRRSDYACHVSDRLKEYDGRHRGFPWFFRDGGVESIPKLHSGNRDSLRENLNVDR